MAKHRICIIEGDGIGHEVIPAGRRVLEATGLDFEFIEAHAGYEYFLEHGTTVPEATLEAVENTDATLFGAATSPSKKWRASKGPSASCAVTLTCTPTCVPPKPVL